MTRRLALVWLTLSLLTVGCGRPPATAQDARLVSSSGETSAFSEYAGRSAWTVFVFVSKDCPCLDAHVPRLEQLVRDYASRGVHFVGVDSEVNATPASAAAQAQKLPFAVMVDQDAVLANALDAKYATYSVLVDREGRVAYRGGIDSDKRMTHDDATPYLRNALDDVLAGQAPRQATGKALGCTLRKW